MQSSSNKAFGPSLLLHLSILPRHVFKSSHILAQSRLHYHPTPGHRFISRVKVPHHKLLLFFFFFSFPIPHNPKSGSSIIGSWSHVELNKFLSLAQVTQKGSSSHLVGSLEATNPARSKRKAGCQAQGQAEHHTSQRGLWSKL